jgi:hypothetical protein
MNDILAGIGVVLFLAGVYLWLGLAATLMITGALLIYAGIVLPDKDEPDQTTNS